MVVCEEPLCHIKFHLEVYKYTFLKNENKPLHHPRDINHVFSLPQRTTRRWTLIFQRRQAIYMNESQFELHSSGAKIHCSKASYTYLGILQISNSLEALRVVTAVGAIWRNRLKVAEAAPAFGSLGTLSLECENLRMWFKGAKETVPLGLAGLSQWRECHQTRCHGSVGHGHRCGELSVHVLITGRAAMQKVIGMKFNKDLW